MVCVFMGRHAKLTGVARVGAERSGPWALYQALYWGRIQAAAVVKGALL